MSNNHHDYGGIDINGGTNAFAIGEGNNIYQNVKGTDIEESTNAFLNILKKEYDKIPDEEYQKLLELIESVTSEANAPEPKKVTISSMLDSINKIVTTLAFSPKITEGAEFWVEKIKSFIGM